MVVEFKPATSDHLSSFNPHIAVPNFVESLDGGWLAGWVGGLVGGVGRSTAAACRCHPSRHSALVTAAAAWPALPRSGLPCPALSCAVQTPQTCGHSPASTLE